jgi:DNA polymerase III epsilon subunit-like protein
VSTPLLDLLALGARPLSSSDAPEEPHSAAELFEGASALFVIDLEMSGPNPLVHEVLDIGGVRASLKDGLPEEGSWGSRIRPRRIGNADPNALRVVRYNAKDWRNAVALEGAFAEIARLGKDAVVTGWGIRQDLSFLAQTFQVLGITWPFAATVLDVQPIARHLLRGTGNVDRFNLGHVADRLGIGRMGEHGALPDAYATYDVLVKLLELPQPV